MDAQDETSSSTIISFSASSSPAASKDDGSEDTFEIEKILAKRFAAVGGTEDELPEYFIKWKGYPDSENTWEPIVNLAKWGKKIYDFELQNYLRFQDNPDHPENIYVDVREKPNDVGKPYVPKEIVGRYQIPNTEVDFYLFQWKDREEPSLVPAKEALEKYTDFMINFYEKSIDMSQIERVDSYLATNKLRLVKPTLQNPSQGNSRTSL